MMSPIDLFRRLTLVPQGITIVVAGFLPIFAIVSMFPAMPSIMRHFGDNPQARDLVPLMVSAPGLTIAILAPFMGIVIDRFGRIKLLTWATLLYGFAGTAPFFLEDLYAVFASRLLLGVAEAVILTAVNTLIGDYWEDTGRRDWLLLQGLAGPALAAGVILIAGPATEVRWNGVFLVYAVAFPVFFAVRAFLFEPGAQTAPAVTAVADNRDTPFPTADVVLVGAVTLLASALYYVFIISGGLAFNEVGVTEPSRISELTALPAMFILVGAVIFRLISHWSNAMQLGMFFLVIGIGLAGIGLAENWQTLVLFLVLQQTGAGMAVTTLIAWAQTKFPYQHRGRGMGVWTACFFFGQFSSPWLVARVESQLGTTQDAFTVAGMLALAAAVIGLFQGVRLRQRTSVQR